MLTREDIYLFSHSTDSFLFNQAVTFKTVIQNEIADSRRSIIHRLA